MKKTIEKIYVKKKALACCKIGKGEVYVYYMVLILNMENGLGW